MAILDGVRSSFFNATRRTFPSYRDQGSADSRDTFGCCTVLVDLTDCFGKGRFRCDGFGDLPLLPYLEV